MRKTLTFALSLLIAGTFLTACGGNNDPQRNPQNTGSGGGASGGGGTGSGQGGGK
ncbi:hypothetical protein JJB07_13655 [Tumebacillus sp. ITR2]|uniref:Uncharacterized protein n=1 Tax=Tumebacillus amylolyticus TaxID=2801339 RepID=A0ABS1JBM8_9BACL|nr:hypothetical protein [Tumebacillus amylolyticus]MBL0387681.1 hypothetical protein [Tumebacillus amylolyticus]